MDPESGLHVKLSVADRATQLLSKMRVIPGTQWLVSVYEIISERQAIAEGIADCQHSVNCSR